MSENTALVMLIGILIVLFWGEPDLHDALIVYFMESK
jgi:hypothetical protein